MAMNIENLREAIRNGRFRVSRHSANAARDDGLAISEIFASVLSGEIIEEYSDSRPYPSCLIYGRDSKGDPAHSVWGYDAAAPLAILITTYRPDPARWIEWRIRRPRNGYGR